MSRILLYPIRNFFLGFLSIFLASCTSNPSSPTVSPTIDHTLTPTQSPTLNPTLTPVPLTIPPIPTTARPFPQHVAYTPGSILPNHRTQAQLDDDIRAFYDYWKATYLMEAGASADATLYRVAFGKDEPNKSTTVSEGQGYGMIIVPIMAGYDPDAQILFDGLWRFARLHPSQGDPRLMDWKVPDESGNNSAFDGDADMAYGLLLADAQWGSEGVINYRKEAETLIKGILESTIGPNSRLPMLGDWVNPSGQPFNEYTPRGSDFMLANFRAYGQTTEDPVWSQVIAQSHEVMVSIQSNFSANTGLIPDFIVMTGNDHIPEPAPPNYLESPNDGNYYYNAGRVPWRVGMNALLNGDSTSLQIVQNISRWAEATTNGNPANFRAGYDMEGNPLPNSDYFTTYFVSPMGVAAMTDPNQQTWLNAIYDSVYSRHENYFEDSVNLLCLLVMTGNFWTP